MPQIINRPQLKQEVRTLLSGAWVSPRGMTACYLMLILALDLTDTLASALVQSDVFTTFISLLTTWMGIVLSVGFTLYCMAVCHRQRAEYLTLFDGFSFVWKIICLEVLTYFFIYLWSMLFLIPGIIAVYRYRFALFNLCENPGISVLDALAMSKRQTMGYKRQLFFLDVSYLGWFLLSQLPLIVEYGLLLPQIVNVYSALFSGAPVPEMSVPYLPAWGWLLLTGLWEVVVSAFFLPERKCMEWEYFETAKETSGVSPTASAPKFPFL